MSITIIKPGIMSSIQDLGRWGFQQYGVPIGGAMDTVSASVANLICGNDEHEAVIEMTLHGTAILFNAPAYCALVGGGCKAFVEETELPFNRLLHIPANSLITTSSSDTGCRSYLAVAGGLEINKEMNSASTYVPSGIGGVGGRNLMTGDTLFFRSAQHYIQSATDKKLANQVGVSLWHVPDLIPIKEVPAAIHVVPGPEFSYFNTDAQEAFFNTSFTISPQSNRMGYRLEGAQFQPKEKKEMVSTAVTAGIVQVTNEGTPVVLMADAQTTGGYPRIGRICSADIHLLAQTRPGQNIRFIETDDQESALRFVKMHEAVWKLKSALKMKLC
jgi:antagonist of KipI